MEITTKRVFVAYKTPGDSINPRHYNPGVEGATSYDTLIMNIQRLGLNYSVVGIDPPIKAQLDAARAAHEEELRLQGLDPSTITNGELSEIERTYEEQKDLFYEVTVFFRGEPTAPYQVINARESENTCAQTITLEGSDTPDGPHEMLGSFQAILNTFDQFRPTPFQHVRNQIERCAGALGVDLNECYGAVEVLMRSGRGSIEAAVGVRSIITWLQSQQVELGFQFMGIQYNRNVRQSLMFAMSMLKGRIGAYVESNILVGREGLLIMMFGAENAGHVEQLLEACPWSVPVDPEKSFTKTATEIEIINAAPKIREACRDAADAAVKLGETFEDAAHLVNTLLKPKVAGVPFEAVNEALRVIAEIEWIPKKQVDNMGIDFSEEKEFSPRRTVKDSYYDADRGMVIVVYDNGEVVCHDA